MIVFFIFSIWLLVLEHTVPHIITHACINIVSYTQSAKENSSSNWKFGIRSSLTDLGLENSSHTVPRQHQIITILKPCSILEHITQEHAVHETQKVKLISSIEQASFSTIYHYYRFYHNSIDGAVTPNSKFSPPEKVYSHNKFVKNI